jgi:hypothetical protein
MGFANPIGEQKYGIIWKISRMKLPNFLIVGAAKCGTTSLYSYLRQHPDIFMPRWKELSLYIGDPFGPLHRARREEYYCRVFSAARSQSAVGEASTAYLYDRSSPGLIKNALGAIKIIIVLRNPVSMAYSMYNHQLRKEGEFLKSFEEALQAEEGRRNKSAFRKSCYGWHANYYYFNRGLYCDQVRRYFDSFGKNNVKIVLFEELVENPLGISTKIFRFLDVDETFVPRFRIHNKGGKVFTVPRFWEDYGLFLKTMSFIFSKNLFRKIPLIIKNFGIEPAPPVNSTTAKQLTVKFMPDIERLEKLIQRDLTAWKHPRLSGKSSQ